MPLSAVPLSAVPLSAVPLSAVPLSAVPLSAVPLSAVPLSAVPLSAVPLSAVPLSAVPLSAVPYFERQRSLSEKGVPNLPSHPGVSGPRKIRIGGSAKARIPAVFARRPRRWSSGRPFGHGIPKPTRIRP